MQKETFLSESPRVILVNYFKDAYDNAIAAARTCYSSKVILTEDVSKSEKSRAQRDAIAESIYEAGHHTVLQHAQFQFTLDRISRQFIWSFLHSHPFYNSEQVSQRYVEVKPENFSVPPMNETAKEIYLDSVSQQMLTYQKLIEILSLDVEKEYFRIFPARKRNSDDYAKDIKKKAQEIARYVLPVATFAHMYHTVSGITLHRYHRLAEQFDTPLEQRLVIDAMIEEVNRVDPLFFKKIEDIIPLEETLEYRIFMEFNDGNFRLGNKEFLREFDNRIYPYTSRLIGFNENGEQIFAQTIRDVLGLTRDKLSDEDAIALVLNPSKNPYLGESLNLSSLSKLMRTIEHVSYTFAKKLSHTADSQNQRHRTIPGSRPVLFTHLTENPDYVTPDLINNNPEALDLYSRIMNLTWKNFTRLLENSVRVEFASYVLPNALAIRFNESGSLSALHHKWVQRLCYNAQEEIFRTSKEEVIQIKEVHPLIGGFIGAPCLARNKAGVIPYCPEGKRYCGIPVWKFGNDLSRYERVL